MPAPASRVRQYPEAQGYGRKRQQYVDQSQAQDHLHHHVEDEEAVHQVEKSQQMAMPTLPVWTAASSVPRGALTRSPGETLSETR